ncbi:MAG TPA: beta/gamma crystallin-related protein [Ramlibacter sp.]|jgi:uncharacterized protein YcfJ
MKRSLQGVLGAAALVVAGHAAAQITLYDGDGFRGRAVTINGPVRNLERMDFNDHTSSIVVERGRWVVCEHARFEGRCVILRRGNYPNLREFGLNNQISSVGPADDRRRWGRYEEMAPVAGEPMYQEWRVHPGERIREVPVASVHAVVGPPNQRCWIERQQVAQPANQPNVGGALIGGLVGGILGHQIGGGSGKDLATAGGAVAGAVVGSNVANQNGGGVATRDVQRCQNVSSATPEYYDVTYFFRGMEHHVQMSAPPGPTVRINDRGEPRM